MPTKRLGRSSYVPPHQVRVTSLRALLDGTTRAPQEPKQFDLLAAISPSHTEADLTLFIAGDAELLKRPCVSVIGTRDVSDEGAARARRVAKELVCRNVVVVSGLAEG